MSSSSHYWFIFFTLSFLMQYILITFLVPCSPISSFWISSPQWLPFISFLNSLSWFITSSVLPSSICLHLFPVPVVLLSPSFHTLHHSLFTPSFLSFSLVPLPTSLSSCLPFGPSVLSSSLCLPLLLPLVLFIILSSLVFLVTKFFLIPFCTLLLSTFAYFIHPHLIFFVYLPVPSSIGSPLLPVSLCPPFLSSLVLFVLFPSSCPYFLFSLVLFVLFSSPPFTHHPNHVLHSIFFPLFLSCVSSLFLFSSSSPEFPLSSPPLLSSLAP